MRSSRGMGVMLEAKKPKRAPMLAKGGKIAKKKKPPHKPDEPRLGPPFKQYKPRVPPTELT